MASKLKTQEVILQSPDGLQEATLSLSDSGVVSSTKPLTLASPTITGTIPQEAWIAPTLLNGWVNFGEPYEPVGYMKDTMGFVHIKGLVKSGTLGSILFTLPVGYRPIKNHIFASISQGGSTYYTARIDVVALTGNVEIHNGGNSFFTLNNITFKAEQ